MIAMPTGKVVRLLIYLTCMPQRRGPNTETREDSGLQVYFVE